MVGKLQIDSSVAIQLEMDSPCSHSKNDSIGPFTIVR
jgi:hypothetical protein